MGDNPRKSPDIPAMLKLSATDKTAFSIISSFPSLNKRFTRQYPGTIATKTKPNTFVKKENGESLGMKYIKSNVTTV
jgi:hypothetical protein